MAISIVRLGSPRVKGEGLRIGTVRRPPRGVRKEDFAKKNYYDVWLPALSPSAELVKLALQSQKDDDEREWKSFVKKFRSEMRDHTAESLLTLLAALSHETDFSVGCYCEDESRCHRSVLRELLAEHGAKVSKSPS